VNRTVEPRTVEPSNVCLVSTLVEALRIIGFCVLAAVTYGIVHDQVTARICVEYFTIGHPPLIPSESPTLLALAWGVVATWWVGLPLGVLVAAAARAGRLPKVPARDVRRSVYRLLLVMAGCALAAGLIGYMLASSGAITLTGPLGALVPRDAHEGFLVDLWAHSASYASGLIGGIVVCVRTYRRRKGTPR
jgi:hypothetical protein